MDDQWTTDVKKSSLQIPYHVKRRLKNIGKYKQKHQKEHISSVKKQTIANSFWDIIENKFDKNIDIVFLSITINLMRLLIS